MAPAGAATAGILGVGCFGGKMQGRVAAKKCARWRYRMAETRCGSGALRAAVFLIGAVLVLRGDRAGAASL
ncbi:MAG: hypothetical protein CR217_18100 [Beijerinckiaceae bacterium]|nr:MAG: hypothetical protein CR217_18100 [Beijerinckiaceae bacterium]